MTQQIAYLEAVIGADIGGFRRGMADVRRDLNVLSDTVEGIGRLGRTMTFAVTTPLVAFGVAAVKAAGSFEASMRNVNSIAQLGESQFKALSARALEFGQSIRAGPQAAAEALYTVFSAGVTDPEKAFAVMSVGVKTAEAGMADLNTTVGAVTASVLAYSNVNLTAARAGDILTRTVALGVGEMNNFARALPYVTPAAAAAGIAFEDVGAALAYLTQQGTPANTAARQLNQAIANIVKPSEGMTAALQKLGVSGIDGLIKKYGNLKDALIALKGTSDGTLEGMMKLFGNQLGARAVFGLTNNVDRLNESWAEFMNGIEGATDLARGQQLQSFEAQFDLMKSAASGLAITIGNVLLPVLTPLIQSVTQFMLGLSKADPILLKIAVSFAAVVAAVGPLLWAFSSLMSPIGLLLGASAGLATAIATDWGGIRSSIEDAVNTSLPAVKDLMNIVSQFFKILFNDETVTTDGQFYVDAPADSMPVKIEGSLWDTWQNSLKEQFPDRDAFIKLATDALQQQYGLTPMQIPIGGIELDLGGSGSSQTSDEMYMQAMGFNEDPKDITSTLGEKLSAAVTNALPQLQTAFSNLFEQAKAYILDTVFPTFDSVGGSILSRIGDSINSTISMGKNGKSPLYDAVRGFLSGGISDALGSVTGIIEKHFPQVSSGFNWLITNIGSWLLNEGIPAFSRSFGYFVGRIGGLIGQGLSQLPQALAQAVGFGDQSGSGGPLGQMAEQFGTSVEEPFNQGFQDAMKDLQITNPGDQLVTSIAGWIGTVLAAKLALSLVTTGVTATVGSILTAMVGSSVSAGGAAAGGKAAGGLALSLGKMVGNAFSSVAGFITPVGAAAGAAMLIVAGYLFNEDIRNEINNVGKQIADGIFGTGFTETARTNIQAALDPIITGAFNFVHDNLEIIKGNVTGTTAQNDGVAQEVELSPYVYGQNGSTKPTSSTQAAHLSGLQDLYASGMVSAPGNGSYYQKPYMMGAQAPTAQDYGMPDVSLFEDPVQRIIDLFVPEGKAGTAIALFGSTTASILQGMADGTADKGAVIAANMSTFAANAVLGLTPLKDMLNSITYMMSALGAMNNLQGAQPQPTAAGGGETILTHAIGGAVHPGLFGMNSEEIYMANNGGSVIPASMVRRGMNNNSGSGETENTYNVVINGVTDTDKILYELRKRGIRLER